MIQLLIAGVEVVLPQNFACTVKRENSFFTKSGEYTYDATLNLDNPTNRGLYGFLQRINKKDQVDTKRSAVLIADGHVYCRGTEVITRWTNESVTIQIVSGESELNYFMGQDQKIEDLDLGLVTRDSWNTILIKHNEHKTDRDAGENYCTPPIKTGNSGYSDDWKNQQRFTNDPIEQLLPQPYLVPFLDKLFQALGYQTINLQDIINSGFDYLFLINTIHTLEYGKMFAGWKVLDLITAIEQLTGCVFIVNTVNNSITAIRKCNYFANATQFTLKNVVDQYEAEEIDADSQDDADWASSNVRYDLPDNNNSKLLELSDEVISLSTIVECADIAAVKAAIDEYATYEEAVKAKVIYRDTSTGRYYIARMLNYDDIKVVKVQESYQSISTYRYTFDVTSVHLNPVPLEVNMFAELHRSDAAATIEIAITPAPMKLGGSWGCEIIDVSGETESSSEEETDPESFFDLIETYSKKESSARRIYAAFFSGMYDYVAIAYTDKYKAYIQKQLYGYIVSDSETDPNDYEFNGSLRLQDIDAEMYAGRYQIDTAHPMTFETYDPNVIDVRQVYVVRNKRFVVRDVEEVITTTGRQNKWKLTCYPITITDTALENRWVLTDGVWDDGGAWLDDGRWLD